MWETAVWTVGSLSVGVLATWYFAKRYYDSASEELRHEAQLLRQMVNALGRQLEDAGFAQLARDENGNIKGIVLELSGSLHGRSHSEANLTVTRTDKS